MSEEAYFNKQIEKGRQRAKLLAGRPDFQQDIAALRAKWDIPQEGIKDPDHAQEWYKGLLQKDEEYLQKYWPQARQTIIKLKEKGTLEDYRKAKKLEQQFNDKVPLNAFKHDVNNLVIKYNQSPRMKDAIEGYLRSDALELLIGSVGITIRSSINADGLKELSIAITEHTTLDDIKRDWPRIKMFQQNLPYYKNAKQQPIYNFDRDQRIFELSEAGKSSKEIAEIINTNFKPRITYTDVGKIIERHKQRLGMN